MIKFLKKNGYKVLRQNGTSYVIMRHSISKRQVTVPNHGSRSLKIGTEQKILKQAGLR